MDGTARVKSLVWFATGAVLTLLATVIVTQAWRADAAPGDSDTTFVPVTPCRLIDTRQPGQVTFGANEVRTLNAHGSNGDCTIPVDAVGLSMNVTAVGATVAGTFLTIWEDLVSMPNASSLNPSPGQPPTPNGVTVPLSPAGLFNVFNFVGSVDVIIDVNGYYTKTSLQELLARIAANEAAIAANSDDIATLDRREPFIVASEPVDSVTALSTPTKIRSVTVDASVNGQVALVASGYLSEADDGQDIDCGLMTSVEQPQSMAEVKWESPVGGDRAHLSASRVFDISARGTTTYHLVCVNQDNSTSKIGSPQVTAIFTPAP